MIENHIKTVLLLGVLTGLALLIGQFFGGAAGLTIGLIFALLMNGVSYFFSAKIVLWMYGAKEADRKQYAKLHEMVAEVSKNANIPKPKVYIVQNVTPNAFATGRNPENGVVACTTGILSLLTDAELRGVIAHEIAHIKNRDILITTIASVMAGVISYAASMARFGALFGGSRDNDSGDMLALLAVGLITPFIALLLQLAISRSREYLADARGATFIKDPHSLASALQKLHAGVHAHPMNDAPAATASMFIVNPFTLHGIQSLLSTHPPMSERVARLKKMNF